MVPCVARRVNGKFVGCVLEDRDGSPECASDADTFQQLASGDKIGSIRPASHGTYSSAQLASQIAGGAAKGAQIQQRSQRTEFERARTLCPRAGNSLAE